MDYFQKFEDFPRRTSVVLHIPSVPVGALSTTPETIGDKLSYFYIINDDNRSHRSASG